MTSAPKPTARVLAFYLPQFHPIPENDLWWGKGFTEWTNVGKARPLFPGHHQPVVPADLGYYDLRVPETREDQARLASEAGIEGFIYWHYWFGNGKRLLERPFNEVLSSGKPDFPFALAWANESWSGTFHGLRQGNMLIEQSYPGPADIDAHFHTILPAFKDPRYITCDEQPIFLIYQPKMLPDAKQFIGRWRRLAEENGLKGIYFIAITRSVYEKSAGEKFLNYALENGFDALHIINAYEAPRPWLKDLIIRRILNRRLHLIPDIRPYRYEQFSCPLDDDPKVIPGLLPNWDHTPRSGKKGVVLTGSTPEKFRQFLHKKLQLISNKPLEHRFLFIKSWNEWGEGNYLEPDLKYGSAYLDAIRAELLSQSY